MHDHKVAHKRESMSGFGQREMGQTQQRRLSAVATLGLVLMAQLEPIDGLSTRVIPTLQQRRSNTVGQPRALRPKLVRPRKPAHRTDDEADEEYDSLMEQSVSGFLELKKSTGSEILDDDLQRQLDESVHPNEFLDKHVADASDMEKIAMSSVTQQLPQAAVEALSQRRKQSPLTSMNPNSGRRGVSREEEIELGCAIQRGAALQTLKKEEEQKVGRSITGAEWSILADMSTKDLRRCISNYRRAKNELVTANLGLVGAVVNQLWSKHFSTTGISKEELMQEGSLGLLRAAELYDPSRGLRFSTYAVVWIKGTLSNSHLSELVRLPDREKTKWRKIIRAQKDLERMGRTEASIEAVAEQTGMSVSAVQYTQQKMNQAQSVLSLDYQKRTQSRSGTETDKVSTIMNDKAMLEHEDNQLAERTQMQADIIAAMARNLDAREARLMRLRYGLNDGVTRSLAECAEAMGVSQTRAQQLAQRCLKKLREAAEAESLQEYLLTIA